MEAHRSLADLIPGPVPAVLVSAAAVLALLDLWASIRAGYKPAIRAGFAWLAAVAMVVLATVFRHDYWAQLGLVIILLAALLAFNWQFIWGLTLYLQDNLAQTFLLSVFYLMTWGGIFAWFGIPDLIWHENWRLRFVSAVASTMVLALFGVCAFYVGSVGEMDIEKVKHYYDTERAHRVLADLLAPRDDEGSWTHCTSSSGLSSFRSFCCSSCLHSSHRFFRTFLGWSGPPTCFRTWPPSLSGVVESSRG